MKRIVLIATCAWLNVFTLSCSAQNATPWTRVEAPGAGFEAEFPCKPEVSKKLFQKEPKEANAFSYTCEFEGMTLSVSLPERFEEFDPSKTKEQLDGIEVMLRTSIGSNATVNAKTLKVFGLESREFEVDSGSILGLQLNVVHPRGVYGIQARGKYDSLTQRDHIAGTARRFLGSFKPLETR